MRTLERARIPAGVGLTIEAGGRRALSLSTAIVALACAATGARPADAQTVSSTGQLSTTPPGTSPWVVGTDLVIGDTLDGTLTVNAGGNATVNGTSVLGNNAGVLGKATISGTDGTGHASTWTNDGDLVVGQTGTGVLDILDGGRVGGNDLYVGVDPGATGTVTIANGGHLTSNIGYVGYQGAGTVLVTGQDSSWETTNRISVGLFGIGHLSIADHAAVSSDDAVVGDSPGAQGDALVTGGATWVNAQQLTIGSYGDGGLRIENGGQVTSSQGYIAAGPGAHGDVTVTGPGSSWVTTTSSITIGNFGTGALNIEDGALVRATTGVLLGISAGAQGTLTLLGTAGSPSVLETTGFLTNAGGADVTIDGGLLRALGSTARYFRSSGPSTFDVTLGTNGAVIDTNGNDIGIDPVLHGPGALAKDGAGTLQLTGNNSYAGATTVNAGTLWVDGDQSAATGATSVASGATLGGSGIIGGYVAIQDGGILAPGTVDGFPRTLTIKGNLVLNTGSILDYEFGQADTAGGALNDLVNIGGDLTLAGTINVRVTTGGDFGPGIYRVFNYDGQLHDNGLLLGGMPPGSNVTVQTSVSGQVNLVNAPAPTGGPTPLLNFWDGDAGPGSNGVVDGGDGVWHVGTDARWTEATGTINAGYANDSFAIFAGKAGTVSVDNAPGAVTASGMQFASDGYRITGGPLTLTGAEAIVRVGDGTAQGAGYTATIAAELTGTAGLAKTDLGTLVLTGANSYTGATRVDGGTLAVKGLVASGITVGVAGRLTGTGRVGAVTNSGIVAPGFGNAMGTLTIQGDYAGNGGRLVIATALGDDSSQTSRLVITGATSGTTQVEIVNRGGLGARTVEGIRIIEVGGASNGRFMLDSDYLFQGEPTVVAGAYGYRLRQGGITNPADGDWYLRSDLIETSGPGEPGEPGKPGEPGGPGAPQVYQPGVPVYEVYAANLLALDTLPTLQQRVGNRGWASGATAEDTGIWGRMEGTRSRANAARSTSGADQDIDNWKVQLGLDQVLAGSGTGTRLVAGITASYVKASGTVRSTFGDGTVKSDGYNLGATMTWYGPDGFYVDGQAQIGRYDSDLKSAVLGTLARGNDGRGAAFSLEIGKRIAIGGKIGITPQVQMAYADVRFDRFTDPSGALVKADRGDSLRTRWGIAIDRQNEWENGRGRVYGIINLNYEWRDGTRVRVADTAIDHADDRLWGELGLGATLSWRKGVTLYGEVSGDSPFRDFGDSYRLKASLGLRMRF